MQMGISEGKNQEDWRLLSPIYERRARDGYDKIEKRGRKTRASVGCDLEVWTVTEVVRSFKKN